MFRQFLTYVVQALKRVGEELPVAVQNDHPFPEG